MLSQRFFQRGGGQENFRAKQNTDLFRTRRILPPPRKNPVSAPILETAWLNWSLHLNLDVINRTSQLFFHLDFRFWN